MKRASNSVAALEAAENAPLLHREASKPGPMESAKHDGVPDCVQIFQILLLCYARMMEPIAFFCVFPYIAEMVQRNGKLPDSDIGFYSGLLESAFAATQVLFLMAWGCLSDRVGRKPVLILSLVGMAMGQVLFGMSTTLWEMAVFRSLTGIFSSANLVIRTMIGENCTPEMRARAYSWYSTSGNIAVFLGPLLGGLLVNPAQRYPDTFSGTAPFEKHPCALPGFLVGSMGITAAILSALFLKETLPMHSTHPDKHNTTENGPTTYEILKFPNVIREMSIFCQVMILAFSFTAISPVVLHTTVAIGGFGFSTSQSTMYITVQGLSETAWLLLAFPLLHSRVESMGIVRICSVAFPCVFAAHILMNALLRDQSDAAHALSSILAWVLMLCVPGVWMAFTAVQLRLNEISPGPYALGKMNSIAELLASLARSVAPPVISSIFAMGVRGQICSGYLAWITLIAFSLPLLGTYFCHESKHNCT
ncbi:major facilitator superfamily transporter [Beauveria bassiana ARSEF 2860]|uniref:Major facilitator superfamily transporter n=1 Tax=Beauveria bassiana (strain ARSEF 2860) TaxID=655819 RepID=J4UVJ0_BEAB2|nr:major facilitator superfamily transporter [Beauveria bassiana ARSEF 2860]EJP70177.1 major facilitator superfamily transporter [Beauveria bassiana ARSEF 2860]